MPVMTPAFSVIIPVFRDWDRLAACLDALERQTLPASEFEIIVADNEPSPTSPPPRLPANARIVHEPRPGSYAARNAAVTASRGRHLAFTDSDCVPEPDWLEKGLAALEADPGARVAGRVSIFREAGTPHYAYVFDLHTAFPQDEYVSRGVCVTANLMVAREVFERVGPFDECFSGGDVEWNRRAEALGIPIRYFEEVRVGHPARHGLEEIFRKRRRTAGSSRRDVSVLQVVLESLKPPVRRFLNLRRRQVGWKEAGLVVLIHWAGRLVEAKEFSLVRLGFKSPNRS